VFTAVRHWILCWASLMWYILASFLEAPFQYYLPIYSQTWYVSSAPQSFRLNFVCMVIPPSGLPYSIIPRVSDEEYRLWSFLSDGTVHWIWRLNGALLLRNLGLSPRPVHVGFEVERMALEQGYHWAPLFSSVSMIAPMPHTLILLVFHQCYIILAIDSIVKLNASVFLPSLNCM
jgi:hypothetical protein